MIVKCQCQHCGGNIEFEAADIEVGGETSHRKLGQIVECPHCHQPTQLYLNKAEFIAPKKSTAKIIKYGWFYVLGGIVLVILLIWLLGERIGNWVESIYPSVGVACGCILGGILTWFVLSRIMQILTALFVCVGLFLIVSGIVDMVEISTAKEATVFQQIYALLEFVGGTLVFCAAMVLNLLRSRLNPPTKVNEKDSRPLQNEKGTP